MASVAQYSALVGKTRAMYGQILKKTDYQEMIRRQSVADIADYLKSHTRYRDDLQECDTENIHRGKLEKMLRRGLIKDYEKLSVFVPANLRSFVRLVYKKYEIDAIKLLFRAFAAGNVPQETLEDSLMFLSRFDRLNIPKLALSRNVSEFINNLQGTEYYKYLRPYLGDSEHISLFQIEMILDVYYYSTLAKALGKVFTGEDKEVAAVLFGSEIDLFNLMTVFRCKVYYKMDKDVINSYWIENTYRISSEMRVRLLAANDKETFLGIVQETPYRDVFKAGDERFYDINLLDYVYDLHYHMFQHKVFTIASMLSYLRIREIELRNLVSLIEGVRYGMPEEQLERYLIGVV